MKKRTIDGVLNVDIQSIRTERLRFEPISKSHSDGMFNLWSEPSVCKYSGTVHDYQGCAIDLPVRTHLDSDRIIDFWVKALQDDWGFRWALVTVNENLFVGTVGFNSLGQCCEIAFHLVPKFWGQGLMSEASQRAIQWAADRGALEIEAFIEPQNERSRMLAARLGFKATAECSEGSQRHFKKLQ